MNRQEARVLTKFGFAGGVDIVPTDSTRSRWLIAFELANGGKPSLDQNVFLESSPGRPEQFTSVDEAASTVAAFGEPTVCVWFTDPHWRSIV